MKKIYVEQYIIGYQPSEWHFRYLFSFGVIDVWKMSIGVGGYGRPSKLHFLWVYVKKWNGSHKNYLRGFDIKILAVPEVHCAHMCTQTI